MKRYIFAGIFIFAVATLLADRLTLTDGSVINGTLKSITAGTATIATDFAGEIKIPADKIVKLNTVGAVEIATEDGTRITGKINTREAAPASEGEATEATATKNPVALPLTNIKYLWTAGMEDPTLPPRRKWDGEVSLDIAGKTGNSEKFNGGAGFVANLVGPVDKLNLNASATYGRENHNTNTKKYLAGADYEHKINDSATVWYVNYEIEQQTTSGLRLRNAASAGFGYYFFEDEQSSLRLRAGLTGVTRKYTDGTHNDATGAEASLRYEHNIQEWGKWVTSLTYQPTFDDIHDYRILHESSLDIPVLFQHPMSLRLGIANEYNSRTAAGADRLETSYFAKMVFKWK